MAPIIDLNNSGCQIPLSYHLYAASVIRVSDCCLTPTQQFSSYIMARTT